MKTRILTWVLAAGVMGVVSHAAAQTMDTCTTDADCGHGFACGVVGGTACATAACPPGVDCPPPEPCTPTEIHGCVPAACATDADCGDGLICLSVTYDACPPVAGGAPDCPPGSDCPPPPPPPDPGPCETHTERYCGPRYAAPCMADADCGDGFRCTASEICSCSAGGGVPTPVPDGEDAGTPMPPEPPPPPDCTCEPGGENYCEPIRTECTAASDCPDGWSCEAETSTVPCTYDPMTGESRCGDPGPSTSICMPPYFDSGWGAARDGSREALGTATGSDSAHAEPPAAPGPMPSGPDAGAGSGSGETGGSSGGGGCSTAPGSAGGGAALAGLALALWVATRRRRA